MTLGPLEYVVIGFPNLVVDGSVATEIASVVEAGTIRIVDLVAIAKNADDDVAVIEIDAKDDPAFAGFAPLLTNRIGLFTAEDVATIAVDMPTGTGALVILFEHHWAVDIKDALEAKGAVLLTRTVIPPEVLEDLADELEAAASESLPASA